MRGILAAGLAVGLAIMVVGTAILASAASLLGLGGGAPAASSAATAKIPAAMLTLYQQAAATCPGLPWTILAAIGTVESDSGRSTAPGVASGANPAGAEGPMQFEPATFAAYAVLGPGGARPPSPYDPIDAVYTACRDKLLDARGQEPVRHAIVLISDGDDNQSRVHPDEVIKECERAETIIYAISTNWTPSRGKGDAVLTQMSEATGGSTFFPPSVEEMSNSFKNIEEELRSQYSLEYRPSDFKLDGGFRTIYLASTDRRFHVRARTGYFAPKNGQ